MRFLFFSLVFILVVYLLFPFIKLTFNKFKSKYQSIIKPAIDETEKTKAEQKEKF